MQTHVGQSVANIFPVGYTQLAGLGEHLGHESIVAVTNIRNGLRPATRRVLNTV
jgi:hypothetical protein